MKNLLLFSCFLLSIVALQAQDQVFLKSGEMQKVTITEIGPSEVKYLKLNGESEVVYSVLRDDILRIVFANGDVMVMVDDLNNPDIYSDQRNRAFKLDFLSPLLGSTALAYEKSIRPGLSWEAGATIIGLGKQPDGQQPRGMGFRLGAKFIKTPDFKTGNMRYYHLLQGFYVRPELISAFYTDRLEGSGSGDTSISYLLVAVNAGKEWVFQDLFVVDIFGGLGYGVVDMDENYNEGYYFGYVGQNESWTLGVTGGLRIGILLK